MVREHFGWIPVRPFTASSQSWTVRSGERPQSLSRWLLAGAGLAW
jgi:hypothetical protein